MAGCDDRCKFTMWSTQCPGSTNDCIAWEFTHLYREVLGKDRLPVKYYFVGDEAFVNTNNFLSPWPVTELNGERDGFNYHLSSSMRQCIERAFGILVNRWGIFWRPLTFRYDKWTLVLRTCAKLHNLCIDANLAVPPPSQGDIKDGDEIDILTPGFNVPRDLIAQLNVVGDVVQENDRRNFLTEWIRNKGLGRPMRR